jgi:hypothetical protein
MKIVLMLMTCLLAANVIRAAAATRPESASPAQPVIIPPPPMSSQYSLLNHRSIFIRGTQTVYPSGSSGGSSGGASRPARPEEALVFNGVTETDHQIVAFIEDTVALKENQYQVGDSIAGGKIVDINLDSLQFESHGKTTTVYVGQNLLGGEVTNLGSAPSSGGPTGPESDIVARMRARRRQELGH